MWVFCQERRYYCELCNLTAQPSHLLCTGVFLLNICKGVKKKENHFNQIIFYSVSFFSAREEFMKTHANQCRTFINTLPLHFNHLSIITMTIKNTVIFLC